MNAAQIARALGGKPMLDGFLCRCPVPGHGRGGGDRNPSLLIKDGSKALLVRCFAGCDAGAVLDELRRRGLMDGDRPGRGKYFTREKSTLAVEHTPDPEAVAIWDGAHRATETIVERYLNARDITVNVPPSLRYSAAGYLDRYSLPAMVAAVQAPDRQIIAVQVTLIDPRGDRKAQVRLPRKTTGALGAGAVRLAAAGDVLGLAEGVETALSAMQLSGVPCWACLGAARMHRVWIPECVRELHIFGDNDEAGRNAAEQTAHRFRFRRVVLRFPPYSCKDWNDALQAQAGRVAA
jgi:hypothetical protein